MSKAKEYLSQLRYFNAYIFCKREEIKQLKELECCISAQRTDVERVQTSISGNRQEDMSIKIADMEADVEEMEKRYVQKQEEIVMQLEGMRAEHPEYYILLHIRYVQGKTLYQASNMMNYSYDNIRHMHGKALAKFEEMYL